MCVLNWKVPRVHASPQFAAEMAVEEPRRGGEGSGREGTRQHKRLAQWAATAVFPTCCSWKR